MQFEEYEVKTGNSFDKKGFLFFLSMSLLAVCVFIGAKTALPIVLNNISGANVAAVGTVIVNNSPNSSDPLSFSATSTVELSETGFVEPTFIKTKILGEKDIAEYIPFVGKFVVADLAKMKMKLFENGVLKKEIIIQSKGQKSSRWETPAGIYRIMTKEKSHFSSIGKVNMPWSMQFYGNFFIHGWPTYWDGSSVPAGFSGGCIRLSTKDSKVVYDFTDIGTSLLIVDSSEPVSISKNFDTKIKKDIGSDSDKVNTDQISPAVSEPVVTPYLGILPTVTAKSYLVGDLDTGEILVEKGGKTIRPIASISKLITAMVVNEAITYDKPIQITESMLEAYGDSGHLVLDKKFTATSLMYPLLMESSNDTANAYSYSYGEEAFTTLMKEKTHAIEMNDSSFGDASGISPSNMSTAEDLFRLGRYLYKKQQYILGITRTNQKTISDIDNSVSIPQNNFNVFAKYPNFLGGKTGKTEAAKETMMAMFTIDKQRNGINIAENIVIIVLMSDDRQGDVIKLMNWAKLEKKGE